MKKPALLTALLLTLLFAACSKSNDDSKKQNIITAQKNDSPWVGTVGTGFKPRNSQDTLVIHGMAGEENLVIKLKLKGTGEYQLTGKDAFAYITVGYDALASTYKLANNSSNRVTVALLNNNQVKGSFKLTLQKISDNGGSSPDILTFTNGYFDAKVSNSYINIDPIVGY